MKVILNADDFGLSESVNKGIVDCFKLGLVTDASLMVNTPFTEHAVKLAKENNITNIGVHLNLTYGKSVLPPEQVPSLVDDRGIFHYVCMLGYYTQYVEAKKELKAQIEKFYDFGLTPSHLDHHHYFNEIPNILKAYLELAEEFKLPVRSFDTNARDLARARGLKTTDIFSFAFHGNGVDISTFEVLKSLYGKNDVIMEIMTTVGYIDDYTRKQTNYLIREQEIETLKEAKAKGMFDDIELIGFKDL